MVPAVMLGCPVETPIGTGRSNRSVSSEVLHSSGLCDGGPVQGPGANAKISPVTITRTGTPSSVNDGYGFLWWLNTGHREWPAASERAYAAVGAGSNIILIDPEYDLILIARWIDQDAVNGLVAHAIDALN